jgi:hypothetical protein
MEVRAILVGAQEARVRRACDSSLTGGTSQRLERNHKPLAADDNFQSTSPNHVQQDMERATSVDPGVTHPERETT